MGGWVGEWVSWLWYALRRGVLEYLLGCIARFTALVVVLVCRPEVLQAESKRRPCSNCHSTAAAGAILIFHWETRACRDSPHPSLFQNIICILRKCLGPPWREGGGFKMEKKKGWMSLQRKPQQFVKADLGASSQAPCYCLLETKPNIQSWSWNEKLAMFQRNPAVSLPSLRFEREKSILQSNFLHWLLAVSVWWADPETLTDWILQPYVVIRVASLCCSVVLNLCVDTRDTR